jgi:Family of unknown function (DUF6529)
VSTASQAGTPRAARRYWPLAAAVALGALVSLTLGVVGSVHQPSYSTWSPPYFSSVATFKVWAATTVLVLACVQLVTALWLYGRLPFVTSTPSRLGIVHRVSGTCAFLLCVPVAFFCLYDYGFQRGDTRVALHSLAGCLFFGTFVVKVTVVRSHGLRGWILPLVGGALIAVIAVLWATSAWWFFGTVGVRR